MIEKTVAPNMFCRLASIVPAVIIVGATLAMFYSLRPSGYQQMPGKLEGRPLALINDLYPVQIKNGMATLDIPTFMKATKEIAQRKSPRAIADLLYLGQSNKIYLQLSEAEQQLYDQFLQDNRSFEQDMTVYLADHLQQYIEQVRALSLMFGDKAIEIALFDTRNPVRGVVYIKNPITGLRVDDAVSENLLRQIEQFETIANGHKKSVVQKLTLKDGRIVKVAMIPVYDQEYGLLAMIRIIIDTSRLDPEAFPDDVTGLLKGLGAMPGDDPAR